MQRAGKYFWGVLALVAVATCAGSIAWGLTDAQKCEAGKLKTAGKYAFCRMNAESKAVKKGSVPEYTKCDQKFGLKWGMTEDSGGGMCPSNGDEGSIQEFITQHTDDVAAALAGGPLPACANDLSACQSDLGICTSDLGTCTGGLVVCSGDLSTCDSSLTVCDGNLSACSGSLATCTGTVGTCNTSLTACNANLGTCNGGLTTCNGNLTTCIGDLGTCSGGLTICNGNLRSCNGSLGTCTGNLGTCNGSLAACTADLSTCDGSLTTCSNDLATCSGSLVQCEAQPLGQRLKTGQNTCYSATAEVSCAGTGQDGELQKGIARQYAVNGDGTITDVRTGLVWESLTSDGSIHDRGNVYTWVGAFTSKIAQLNFMNFAGHNDWRLPNVNELQSLVDYGQSTLPALDPVFKNCTPNCNGIACSCTQPSLFWTASTYRSNPPYGWTVDGDGQSYIFAKTATLSVRAVRGPN